MKFGLNLPVINRNVTPAVLSDLAVQAEELGFVELYLGEHVVLFDEQIDSYPGSKNKATPFPADTPLPDPLMVHAYLAASTSRVRLATGIMILPQRNPIYTAKHLATLDWLTGGRVDVGIGLGWSRLEYAAVGVPWEDRGARCDEAVDVMRSLWGDDPAHYEGKLWSFSGSQQFPKPVQKPGPPLWFGGTSDGALSRVAKRGDGWYTFNAKPEWLAERVGTLERYLSEVGRSLSDVSIMVGTAWGRPLTQYDVSDYQEVGVEQLALSLLSSDPADLRDELQVLGSLCN